MRIPEALSSLVDHGIIERVLRPLMSGKEAQIHLIESGGEQRVAKVYKDAQERTFQNRADYTEGRKVRNSRDQRAMDSRSKHGRAQNEAAWKTAEVDMIYRLRAAGVRVPEPFNFIDGVLIMELVSDAEGFPAPRLGDLTFEPEEATRIFHALLAEVVRMLCAGVVHGDLSDFNVLLAADGPVIIDFPQAIDASSNQNARKLLLRDVDNLHRFHAKFAPEQPRLPYAEEMWELYQRNALVPETQLTGKFRGSKKPASTEAVLGLIADANHDERRRREKLGLVLRDKVPEQARQREPRQEQGRQQFRPQQPRSQQPQQREPRQQEPRQQRPHQRDPRHGQPRQEQPRQEQPRHEQPRHEQPRQQTPLQQQPRQREPHHEQPRQQAPRQQQPRAQEQRPVQREQARPQQPRSEQSTSKWGARTVWRPERPTDPRTRPLDGPLRIEDDVRPTRNQRDRRDR